MRRRTADRRWDGGPRPRRRAFAPESPTPLERREVPAVVLPPGFTESVVVSGLNQPESMAIAPDGRVFVGEAGGTIRIVQNGRLLPTPFDTLPVGAGAFQGLEALAFDPNFRKNHYVYAYYIAGTGTPDVYVNRLVRITAAGDRAVPGSEKVLAELPPFVQPPDAAVHVGAAMHFGTDGKIYISTGDLSNGPLAQSLANPFGKILRFNPNGTIPRNNPFFAVTTGVDRAIWAVGLRNPYTFAIQSRTGKMYINDVGESTYEEIDLGIRGANYGWPVTEGPTTNPLFVSPIYSYTHAGQVNTAEVAISGGDFYNPARPTFPRPYRGSYFFEDYGNGWIERLDAAGQVHDFASGLPAGNNDLDVAPNGSLDFLNFFDGTLSQITYTASARR